MALIFPFAALRPEPRVAAAVAAVPYDVVSIEEARALAADRPLSFLRVSRAEIDLPPSTPPYADRVYEQAAENFEALQRSAPLVVEARPSLYIYRLHMGEHVQTGVAGCFALDEYERGLIRKHEKTRPDKEDDRTRHMLAIGAQTGPVFLTYQASPGIDGVVQRACEEARLFDFQAADGVRHVVWRVPEADAAALAAGFAAVPQLYIADGHHRAASAARARQARAGGGPGEHDRMLGVAFPDRDVQILPYHRVVRDLHGRTPDTFLEALGSRLTVEHTGQASPRRKGEVGMYLAGTWHALRFPESSSPDPASALDVSRLQETVLAPLLGIQDVRTDKRIAFVGGIRGTAELERLVNSGAWAVAFAMFPVSVGDLMHIADAGGIMPPKSTWFEPKLRDGLLSHLI